MRIRASLVVLCPRASHSIRTHPNPRDNAHTVRFYNIRNAVGQDHSHLKPCSRGRPFLVSPSILSLFCLFFPLYCVCLSVSHNCCCRRPFPPEVMLQRPAVSSFFVVFCLVCFFSVYLFVPPYCFLHSHQGVFPFCLLSDTLIIRPRLDPWGFS